MQSFKAKAFFKKAPGKPGKPSTRTKTQRGVWTKIARAAKRKLKIGDGE